MTPLSLYCMGGATRIYVNQYEGDWPVTISARKEILPSYNAKEIDHNIIYINGEKKDLKG